VADACDQSGAQWIRDEVTRRFQQVVVGAERAIVECSLPDLA
jgi:hypothetical protein